MKIKLRLFFLFCIIISLTGCMSSLKYNNEISVNNDKNDSSSRTTIDISGITTVSGLAVAEDSNENKKQETIWIQFSTDILIIGGDAENYIISIMNIPGNWKFPKKSIITGFEQVDEYKRNRLMSTYNNGPNDGYSWHQRNLKYDSLEPFSKDKLVSTVWYPLDEHYGFVLVFYLDGIFRYGAYDSGVRLEGEYVISEDTVILSDIDTKFATHKIDGYLSEINQLSLKNRKINFYYADDGLIDDQSGITFYAVGSAPDMGSIVDIDGTESIIINKNAIITTNSCAYSDISEKKIYLYKDDELIIKKYEKLKVIAESQSHGVHYFYCLYKQSEYIDSEIYIGDDYLNFWIVSDNIMIIK